MTTKTPAADVPAAPKRVRPSRARKPVAAKPAEAAPVSPAIETVAIQPPQVTAPAPVEAPVKSKKKKAGDKKPKLVRDSFTLPEADYALFKSLKSRCLSHGVEVKKTELLRIALGKLAAMSDKNLLAAVNDLERLKTGRPAK